MEKILLVTSSLQAGGAERVTVNLAKAFNENGIVCDVLVGKDEKTNFYTVPDSIKVYYQSFAYEHATLLNKLIRFIKRSINTRNYIKASKAEVLIAMKWEVSFRVALSSVFMRKQRVFCEHNHYYAIKSRLLRWGRNIVYLMFADKVTVLTNRDKANYPFFLKHKIFVVPNPLGIESDVNIKRESSTIVRLCAVGNLARQKGFDRLLDIFSDLKSAGYENIRLNIAGDGKDSNKLKDKCSKLGLDGQVSFLGKVKDIEALYLKSDVYVMTSRWEGLPMVLGEAMNFSLPIVAYDCPTGPREFIVDGDTGFLVADGNKDEFKRKLLALVEDSRLRSELGNRANDKSKYWSAKNVLEIWKKLLDE